LLLTPSKRAPYLWEIDCKFYFCLIRTLRIRSGIASRERVARIEKALMDPDFGLFDDMNLDATRVLIAN